MAETPQTNAHGPTELAPVTGRARRSLGAIGRSDTLWFVVTVVGALVIWEIYVRATRTPEYLLPAPSAVIAEMFDRRDSLLTSTIVTGREVVLGFLVATVAGIPLAAVIAYSKILDRILSPLLVSFQTVPKVALAPLFVVWLGHDLLPKVVVAFTIAFFPIVIDTAVGLRSANPGTIELVRSMGASRWQLFTKVQFPGALPNIFGGLEVAMTLAVIGAVVGEYIAANDGLGYLQITAAGVLNTPLMFGSIIMMSALGLALFRAVQILERLIIPWHTETAER